MPESTFNHPLFGPVRFRTASKLQWIRGDAISFVSGFDEADILSLQIPQLAGIDGANNGHLRFHKRGHAQLLRSFEEIAQRGLLHHIKTCAGTLNKRLRKPVGGGLSKLPSNHAFGIAIDLNSDDGSMGGSVAPVAPIFQANGFIWGKSFNDPMHFEVNTFVSADSLAAKGVEAVQPQFIACGQKVHNRGAPPEAFLTELVKWGRGADNEVFERNGVFDIYSSVVSQLGPWRGELHRRAVMLEVLRVLAGFESSWKWDAGRDVTNPNSGTSCTEEAGIFQCSGNSMAFSPHLRQLLVDAGGDGTCESFIKTTKSNHRFALEYCARLMRVTTKHHGPIKNGHIHSWLRRDAVDEFMRYLGHD
ncbi:M15 family metallopeptidase [Variovorax sp. J22G73]|uniref:M15 family metallopeptidase n=1 Tax=unclassified Variovorax TaxID=663243 RepID=UPI002574FB95|nr:MULTISPECIES: M15 family metallopeptidase [unclassified Variovorax]MDM0009394.1 M15 family metallopeptidase [Variovorax sp. J22R203]MDM0101901.1 M15 family metallopeptidase [Variovorax sp. J22G73]